MLTLKKANRILESTGYELVQGNGYLYFWSLNEQTPLLRYESVAVCKLNHATLDFYVLELEYKTMESYVTYASDVLYSDESYIRIMKTIQTIKKELGILESHCYESHYATFPSLDN